MNSQNAFYVGKICTTDVRKVDLIKNKQNRPPGKQSPECHRYVQSPSAPYYSSSYRSTSHYVVYLQKITILDDSKL